MHGESHRTERAHKAHRARTHGVRPARVPALDMPRLLGALARLKVWELARLGEISVERLIARVVRASDLPSLPVLESVARPVAKKRPNACTVVAPTGSWMPPTEPPALEGLPGRITLEDLDALVNYWALSVTLQEHAWNVTHAAARLSIGRRALRVRWQRVLDLSPDLVAVAWSESSGPLPSLPAPPPLAKMLADGVSLAALRKAARSWLVTCTMTLEGGNRTSAAESLGTTRRSVREHLATYAAEHDTHAATGGSR